MTIPAILSLNGSWDIAESTTPEPPKNYARKVPVPGLAKLAQPPFDGLTVAEIGWLPLEARQRARPDPRRDYFWYRRTFPVVTLAPVMRLRFAKAQFGIRVWLNGRLVGDHDACFSSAMFEVSSHLVAGENEIVVRVGAHPLMAAAGVPTGSDHEKYLWTAGLYDNVELLLSGSPTIEEIQIAPDINKGVATVTWTVRNRLAQPVQYTPKLVVATRATGQLVAEEDSPSTLLAKGEIKRLSAVVSIPEAQLWTPDSPFLYEVTASTGGDTRTVAFGMREFRTDSSTRRAWLNNRICFLRGTNITLHRFFEDPACGTLPWTESWVRKLLGELPKRYNWNIMRWSIGPVPEFWLRIADEVGLMVEYEFPIWTWRAEWSHETSRDHVQQWMADSWNHPSVVWWSLSNETRHPPLVPMVGVVRKSDLSGRPWSNGYNLPEDGDDPIDDHPYKWHAPVGWPAELWSDAKYSARTAENTSNAPHPSAHASVANEYCWFWLKRDGEPTDLTAGVYARYLSRARTADQRRELYAYYLAGETEYFRAHRNFAGVMHFTYLTCDHPWALTGDLFSDVARLRIHDVHDAALRNAFHPLGVYLAHWERSPLAGSPLVLHAMIVNDDPQTHEGELSFEIEDSRGQKVGKGGVIPFSVRSLGQQTYRCDTLRVPAGPGLYGLSATACSSSGAVIVSRRQFEIVLPTE